MPPSIEQVSTTGWKSGRGRPALTLPLSPAEIVVRLQSVVFSRIEDDLGPGHEVVLAVDGSAMLLLAHDDAPLPGTTVYVEDVERSSRDPLHALIEALSLEADDIPWVAGTDPIEVASADHLFR